jgi:hypothetical protein
VIMINKKDASDASDQQICAYSKTYSKKSA